MSATYSVSHYEDIAKIENHHFWFISRGELLSQFIKTVIPVAAKKTFLEVGCGTGIVIRVLEKLGLTVTGLDINDRALMYAKKGTNAIFVRKSFLLFSPEKKYDAVGMFDVVEHIKDDDAFLQKAHDVLKSRGILFLTVPAGMWLWSRLDTAAGHVRRYEYNDLVEKLEKSGFEIVRWNYWGFFTLPMFIIKRFLSEKMLKGSDLDGYFEIPNSVINFLLLLVMRLEHSVGNFIHFPTGATLIIAARKK